jgi:hypothetical protein
MPARFVWNGAKHVLLAHVPVCVGKERNSFRILSPISLSANYTRIRENPSHEMTQL